MLTLPREADHPPCGALAAVHDLYGIRVRTPWPVAGVPSTNGDWDVEFVDGDHTLLDGAAIHVLPAHRHQWA